MNLLVCSAANNPKAKTLLVLWVLTSPRVPRCVLEALEDLVSARASKENKEKEGKRRQPTPKPQPRTKRVAKQDLVAQLLDFEHLDGRLPLPSFPEKVPASHSIKKPCVITRVHSLPDLLDRKDVQEKVQKPFLDSFLGSSLRVREGRAQRQLSDLHPEVDT